MGVKGLGVGVLGACRAIGKTKGRAGTRVVSVAGLVYRNLKGLRWVTPCLPVCAVGHVLHHMTRHQSLQSNTMWLDLYIQRVRSEVLVTGLLHSGAADNRAPGCMQGPQKPGWWGGGG